MDAAATLSSDQDDNAPSDKEPSMATSYIGADVHSKMMELVVERNQRIVHRFSVRRLFPLFGRSWGRSVARSTSATC